MGKIVVEHAVVREPNTMYFINGNGDLCSAPMQHGGKKKGTGKKKAKKAKK